MKSVRSILKKPSRLAVSLLVVAGVSLVIGCATFEQDRSAVTPLESINALPENETLYAYLDIAKAGGALVPVVQQLFGDSDITKKFLDRTDYLLLAVSAGDADPRFTVIAIGEVPVVAVTAGLNVDRNWKRQPGRMRWWVNGESGLNIAIPDQFRVIASSLYLGEVPSTSEADRVLLTSGAISNFAAAVPMHAGTRDLIVVTEDLSTLAGLGIPSGIAAVKSAQLLANIAGDMLAADIELRLDTAAAARLAGMVVRLLVVAERMKGGAGYFGASEVEVDDVYVRVAPVNIALSAIAQLLGGTE